MSKNTTIARLIIIIVDNLILKKKSKLNRLTLIIKNSQRAIVQLTSSRNQQRVFYKYTIILNTTKKCKNLFE